MIHADTLIATAAAVANAAGRNPAALRAIIDRGNQSLIDNAVDCGALRQLRYTPTPFAIDHGAAAAIGQCAATLSGIVETIIGAVAAGDANLREFFGEHAAFFALLARRGPTWQVFSRYDFLVTAAGDIRFIELNTSCPAGYLYAAYFDRILAASPPPGLGTFAIQPGFQAPEAFGQGVARAVGLPATPGGDGGLVAVLFDENELAIELDLIARSFEAAGFRAGVHDARRLRFDGRHLLAPDGEAVALTYNKFRVRGSEPHYWRPGFEERYAGYLAASRAGAFRACNGFGGMVIGEDKAMLAVMSDPRFAYLFSPAQRQFIDRHIPWTRTLGATLAGTDAASRERARDIRGARERYVVKPRNDGRGRGVAVGSACDAGSWDAAVHEVAAMNGVVQEAVASIRLPVVSDDGNGLRVDSMYQTGAIYMLAGEPAGIISRVSTNAVANVGLQGFMQPVALLEDPVT